jgi:hypothetical protein
MRRFFPKKGTKIPGHTNVGDLNGAIQALKIINLKAVRLKIIRKAGIMG